MPWPQKPRLVGTRVQRIDGPDKATGRAKYSYDVNRRGLLHARILRSRYAHARVTKIDTSAAEKVPGFRAFHILVKPGAEVFFAGAELVAICADTEEHAEDCLKAIRVTYDELPHLVREDDVMRAAAANEPNTLGVPPDKPGTPPPPNLQQVHDSETKGFAKAFDGLQAVVQGNYGIAVIAHQCLEPHGLVAEWDEKLESLTVWASTQAVWGTAVGLSKRFGLQLNRVKCITHHMGGGYGSKFGADIQGEACVELARKARAPVKLMLDRAEEVTVGGMRPSGSGIVRIGADAKGNFRAFEADCLGSPGIGAGNLNMIGLPYVYGAGPGQVFPQGKRRLRLTRMNIQRLRAMRAPGHPQMCFISEQAVDDLAARLNMNPMDLRLRNLPQNDATAAKKLPQSWAALRHTIYTREIELARKLSHWNDRWHPPGRGDKGIIKRGIGMAIHTWGGGAGAPNEVHVGIGSDGSVEVRSSTQDLGTAEKTVLAIVVAEVLGLNPTDITVRIGESNFGPSSGSGGSTTCPGTAPVAFVAAEKARDALFFTIAARLKSRPSDLAIEEGSVIDRRTNQRWPWRQVCARLGTGTANASATSADTAGRGLSNLQVGGVQTGEVSVDTETGVVRCTRFVAVQDCGTIINKLGCETQVAGGVIMGINYALFEECIYDRVTGRMCNPDMEFYKLGGIQDMPPIVVHMMDMPERGVIGIGEPPTISTAAAIGNAIFNALGVRVPRAPFTPDRVLAALAGAKKGGNG